jgi:uncharacterized protein
VAPRAQRGQLLQQLTFVNPWWSQPGWQAADLHLLAAERAPFDRWPKVLDTIRPPNLYILRGPRRAGKTTLLKQTIARLCTEGVDPRRICYFAADALGTPTDLINLFQAARQLFPDVAGQPRFFFIDEITAVPDWQRGMKWVRDNSGVAGDCVVATGSSARDIAVGSGELAGRRGPEVALDRILLPMSFPEFVRCAGYTLPAPTSLPFEVFYQNEGRRACQDALVHLGPLIDAFEAYLLVGGFPQAVADFRRAGTVSDGFVRDLWDVTQADLRRMGVSRPEQGLRLLERIGVSLTSVLGIRTLAESLDTAHSTASLWVDALAETYLLFLLFQEKGGLPDVRSQRKAYPIDPLIALLPGRHDAGAFVPESSRLAELVIATSLFRAVEGTALDRFNRPTRIFFYRTQNGTEVDFIVPPVPHAVESKYVDRVTVRHSAAMVANFGGGLLLTRSAVDIVPAVTVLPAAIFTWLLEQTG